MARRSLRPVPLILPPRALAENQARGGQIRVAKGREQGTASAVKIHGRSSSGRSKEQLSRSGSEVLADAALLAQARRGDRDSLGELYNRHATPAYSLATRLVGATAASDVVHDAFVALLDKPATFNPDLGSFRAWFMTAVHRRCLNLLRRDRPTVGEEALVEVAATDPEPLDAIVESLRDASVRTALLRLPAEQRDALVMAYYGGLSQTEISERLGTPLGTVKARMRRGLISLRGLLRGEGMLVEEEAVE